MKIPDTKVPMIRYLQLVMKYPHTARVISPTAQKPTHPQKVLQLGVTNSRGRTKLTTSTPTERKNCDVIEPLGLTGKPFLKFITCVSI